MSLICFRPLRLDERVDVACRRRSTARRTPAARRCSRSCRRRCGRSARPARGASPGSPSMPRASAFRRRETSPISQLATSFGWPLAFARGLVVARERLGSASSARRRTPAGRSRAGSARPSRAAARASRRARARSTRRDHQRRQVGVGEVAVVVRVFLAAHRARLAAVGVEQHGGLLRSCRPSSIRSICHCTS